MYWCGCGDWCGDEVEVFSVEVGEDVEEVVVVFDGVFDVVVFVDDDVKFVMWLVGGEGEDVGGCFVFGDVEEVLFVE